MACHGEDQLRHAQESVANIHKLHEIAQSKLFELRAQSDEESAAKHSEVSLLMDEFDRANASLLSLSQASCPRPLLASPKG